jgi:hypothetical protein
MPPVTKVQRCLESSRLMPFPRLRQKKFPAKVPYTRSRTSPAPVLP